MDSFSLPPEIQNGTETGKHAGLNTCQHFHFLGLCKNSGPVIDVY